MGLGVVPSHILVHVAVPVGYETPDDGDDQWAEGEPNEGPVALDGKAFACVIFLPSPGGDQQNPYRPRAVRTPTMLCNPTRSVRLSPSPPFPGLLDDLSPIVLDNQSELLITAPELAPWTGAVTARWQVDGVPQPFGRPGTVLGILTAIRQVVD